MTALNIRVDENVKNQAKELFADLGLDISTAVNMFLRQAIIRNGLPFEVLKEVPNAETLAAIAEVQEMKKHPEKHKGYTDIDEMFKELLK